MVQQYQDRVKLVANTKRSHKNLHPIEKLQKRNGGYMGSKINPASLPVSDRASAERRWRLERASSLEESSAPGHSGSPEGNILS